MAEKRMFSQKIIDSDHFLDMALSTQSVYFHLSMRADDEGFVNNPKKILRMIGANEDEIKLLIAKNFILDMNTGVVVIKHWHIHNHIRKDRVKYTSHTKERSLLSLKENGAYTVGQPDVNQVATKCTHSIDKSSIDKSSIGDTNTPFSFVLDKKKSIEHTSKEYKNKLKAYIHSSGLAMTYEDFYDKCVLKDYKYKDFKRAYNSWNKEATPTTTGARWAV